MTVAAGIEIHAPVDGYGEAWNAHDLDVIMSFTPRTGRTAFTWTGSGSTERTRSARRSGAT
jgi:hypothetical protein